MALESYFQEETKYSVIERMGLAIVEGIKHFRVYLEGVPFRIETDHNLLSHLSQLKDSHRCIALQPYNYTMVYQPRRRNGNADGISREHASRLEEEDMSGMALLSLTSQPSLYEEMIKSTKPQTQVYKSDVITIYGENPE